MIFCFEKLEFKSFLNVSDKLGVAQNSKSQVFKGTNKKPHTIKIWKQQNKTHLVSACKISVGLFQ